MIFSWTYFLLLQLLVLLTYFFKRKDSEDHAFSKLFPTKIHFVFVNLSVFVICYLYNSERQLFCNPVPWATILVLLFIVSFLTYPFIKRNKTITSLMAFLSGLGVFMSIYLVLFARWEYLIFLAFNIPVILILHFLIKFLKRKLDSNVFNAFYFYPAIILTPFFLLYQLWMVFKTLANPQKRIFFIAPALTLTIMVILSLRISHLVNEIKAYNETNNTELLRLTENPIDNYLTELILGAHWKYHTQLCLYDGWRPPYHDPVLVSANKILNPFSNFDQGTTLPRANELYKETFPDKETSFDCRCAKNERLFDIN
jgi:hypothetical protein